MPEQSSSANLNAVNQNVVLNLPFNTASVVVQLLGTWSGTVSFEGTANNGASWVSVQGTPVGGGSGVTSATGDGCWQIPCAGLTSVRARVSSYASGTILATITSSAGSPAGGGSGGGGTVTANQGTPNTVGNAWPVEVTDGTNVLGTPTNPIRVDPTGTTVQPVSGSLSITGTVSENVAEWGGTAVSAPPASGVPAVGTEVAPVVKPIQRKSGVPNASPTAILTTTPLAANGNYTSSWVDTFQTGDHFVQAVAYPGSIASASNGFQIQSTDDTSNTQTQTSLRVTSLGTSGLAVTLTTRVTQRYWRVVYTNGATLQSVFELTAVASAMPSNMVVSGDGTFTGVSATSANAVPVSLASGFGVADGASANAQIGGNNAAALVGNSNSVYNGASWDRQRTPNVFKTAQATASGNTALWTPASGKKFRLMRLFVQVTANAYLDSGAGVLTVTFQDATTGINLAFDVYLPAASVSAPLGDAFASGWIDLGNGVLSATANNVLNINLSGKVDAGNVRVTCCGTEE